jgi:tetratricopeptide (TPR) repeat protein
MIQSYKQWTQTYPNDWAPWANLTNLYTDSARYAEAITAGRQALKLMPDHGGVYFVLARAYSRSNDFQNAKAICARAVAKGLDGSDIHNLLYEIAFAEDDAATMAAQVAKETGQSSEYLMLSSQGSAAAASGRIREARAFYDRAADEAKKTGADSAAEVAGFRLAEIDAAVNTGDLVGARKIASEASGLEGNEFAPLVVAKTGDTDRAVALLDELLKRNPREATIVQDDAPVTRAAMDLQEGRPQDAIAELKPALKYELRNFELPTVLARAYLEANLPTEAAGEYRKIIAHHGVDGLSILYPLAYLGLARAELKLGDVSASRSDYQRFFNLWQDADPNLPILLQAKREYAGLN